MVGKVFSFKVLKYNRKRSNIVLSRRVILEKEREEQRSTTLTAIHEGKIVEGVVQEHHRIRCVRGPWRHRRSAAYHGYLLGPRQASLRALLRGPDHHRKGFGPGPGKGKSLPGHETAQGRPWTTASERYPVGTRVSGKVVSLTDYGAFVELEEGIEGLIHVSEMSWTRKIRHPSKVVSVGDELDAVVLDIKPTNRRVSLGMKQVAPNPWDVIGEKYPSAPPSRPYQEHHRFWYVHRHRRGHRRSGSYFRHFLDQTHQPSWRCVQKGDEVRAIVLHIDRENERFSLGIKQLEPDPWETISERYRWAPR